MNSELYTMPMEYYRSLAHKGKKGMKWGYNDGKRNGKRTAGEDNEYGRTPEEQAKWEEDIDVYAAEYGVSAEEAEKMKKMSEQEWNATYLKDAGKKVAEKIETEAPKAAQRAMDREKQKLDEERKKREKEWAKQHPILAKFFK